MNSPESFLHSSYALYALLLSGAILAAVAVAYILFRESTRRRLIEALKIEPSTTAPVDLVFPDSKFAVVMGFNIRYVERGLRSKPTVVLIHGFSAYIYAWRWIIDELAKNYHVVAFDLPGFGLSDKHIEQEYGLDHQTERVFRFLDHIQVDTFALVGHSMGGGIAAWMTKKHPERVKKLVLLAPAVGTSLVWFPPGILNWAVPVLKWGLLTPTHFRRIYRHVSRMRDLAKDEEALKNYYAVYATDLSASAAATYKHLHLLRDQRLKIELRDIHCPVLVMGGAKDPVIRISRLESFLKSNPNAKLVTHPDSGHLLAEEAPAFVVSHLERFLKAET